MSDRAMMTINEFTDWGCVSRTRTYELIRTGELKAVKAGRRTLIRADAAQAWLDALPSARSAGRS